MDVELRRTGNFTLTIFLLIYLFFHLSAKTAMEVLYKKAILKNFAIFTGKHLLCSLFSIRSQAGLQLYEKETSAQSFSCKYYEIFKNTYFEENL